MDKRKTTQNHEQSLMLYTSADQGQNKLVINAYTLLLLSRKTGKNALIT